MNFLGHLYFSGDRKHAMLANLYGDFVKGKKYESFPAKLKEGVLLHRRIDHFIDSHREVKVLSRSFYEQLPKVSNIAIDLFFDHLLAKRWHIYHSQPLHNYIDGFLTFALDSVNNNSYDDQYFKFDPNFSYLVHRLHRDKWIQNYSTLEGLAFAAKGLSSRISFTNQLHLAPELFVKNEAIISKTFEIYMQDALSQFNPPI